MVKDIAIAVQNLTKIYKLYNKSVDRLKESLHPFRKKYHHDFFALNDVSFEIKKGDTVGIIGKNGSGKSTLLKIITGVLTPTSGFVNVNGKVSALLELGAGFNPELTGVENVYFNGMLMGYSSEDMNDKLDDILSFADIGEFVHQPVKTYSSGMFVRLAFSVAINVAPDILIVDEALSVGDALFQSRCFEKIDNMRKNGVTLLLVTHSLSTFQSLCDYGILLDNGLLCAIDGTSEISFAYYKLQREMEQNYYLNTSEQKSEYTKINYEAENITQLSDCLKKAHRVGSMKAKFVNVLITNDEGQQTFTLETGKKFRVIVKVLFTEDVYNPIIALMIKNIQGLKLFGIHTLHTNDLRFGVQKKDSILEVSIESEMALNPGKYVLSLVTSDQRSEHDYDVLDSIDQLVDIEVFGEKLAYGIINSSSNICVLSNTAFNY